VCEGILYIYNILHIQHNGDMSLENAIIQSITYGNLRFI